MVNAQQWLDHNYPKKERESITKLQLNKKELEGTLEISSFRNLRELNLSENRITSLTLNDCPNLELIDGGFNQLTEVSLFVDNKIRSLWFPANLLSDLPKNINQLTLEVLGLRDNLFQSNLNIFSNFVNLRKLYIGQNNFVGSLSFLAELTKLEEIHLFHTEIDSGLEFLPDEIKRIYCGGTKLATILGPYFDQDYALPEYGILGKDGYYNFSAWKEDNKKTNEKHSSFARISWLSNPYLEKKWTVIHPSFTRELQKEWENKDFDYQQTREWIKCGLKITDSYYAQYLRGTNKNFQWFIKYGDRDLDDLLAHNFFTSKSGSRLSKDVNLNTKQPIQSWFDGEYSKKKKIVTELNIASDLTGPLEIKNFPFLETIYNEGNYVTSLSLINLPKLKNVYLTYSPISKLVIKSCPSIEEIDVSVTDLSKLDWLEKLESDKLKSLTVVDNKFPAQDLSLFSRFINLERLYINTNNFTGSLEWLKDLSKLRELNVTYTQINSGLEHLPSSLNNFICAGTILFEELAPYQKDLVKWRSAQKNKDFQLQQNDSHTKRSKNAKQRAKLNSSKEEIDKLKSELENEKLRSANLEKKIVELEQKLNEQEELKRNFLITEF